MRSRTAFSLIELLVSVSVISGLMSILLPALSSARRQGIGSTCQANLRTLGQGLAMYGTDHMDQLPPARLPKVDNDNWRAMILGGFKYRPTFLAMMGTNVGIQPFDDPLPSRTMTDRCGEPGDRQNYSGRGYVCPAVSDWTDERNGSYGYNYQFLGNSRLSNANDIDSFKNWPIMVTRIRDTSRTVAVADSMGTAATFAESQRRPYASNAPGPATRLGNEGFNLDPPRIDPINGEAASYPNERTSVDPRHGGKTSVLFVDTHCENRTPQALGYPVAGDGSVGFDGNNALWTGTGQDVAWTPRYKL